MFNPLKHLMPPLASVEITDSMAREYQTADPYPHIVIDNFINDVSFVDKIVDEYQKYEYWGHDSSDYSKNHQVKKFFSPWCDANINDIPPNTKTLINYLNSTHVLNKLEKLTGIQSLEPDLLLEAVECIESIVVVNSRYMLTTINIHGIIYTEESICCCI